MGSTAVLVNEENATRWVIQPNIAPFITYNVTDEVQFLVCIKEGVEHAFNYSITGGRTVAGVRRVWNVSLVDTKAEAVFYASRLVGANPPSFTTVTTGTTRGWQRPHHQAGGCALRPVHYPPAADRPEPGDILSLTFSPDGKYLLVAKVVSSALELAEYPLGNFSRPAPVIKDSAWKPGTTFIDIAYAPDGAGLVAWNLKDSASVLDYLLIGRSAGTVRFNLAGSAPCEGLSCRPGPVLPGNLIRRGDCEWNLDRQLTCTPRFTLPGYGLASSEDGAWLVLGPYPPPTPTAIPTGTRFPPPHRPRPPRPPLGQLPPVPPP